MNRRAELAIALAGPVLAGAVIAVWGELGAGLILAVIAFAAAAARPAAMLPVALILGLLQFGPTKAYAVLPIGVSYIDDVMVIGLFCGWLVQTLRERLPVPRGVVIPLALLAAVGALSTLLHVQPADQMLLAFRGILLPATLYLVSARYAEDPTLRRRLVVAVVALACLNAVTAIAQWISDPGRVDSAYGLLGEGGANALGLLALMAVCIAVGSDRVRSGWPLIVGLAAGMVASSARAAMIASLPALVVAMRHKMVRARSFVLVGLLTAVVVFSVTHYYRVSGRKIAEDLAPSYLLRAQYVPEQGGRMLYLAALPSVFRSSPFGWLVGVGPGGFTSYVGVNSRSESLIKVAPASSISETGLANADSEWVALLGEYGLIGLGCMLVLMIRPAVVAVRRQRAGEQDAVTAAMPGIVLVALVGATAMNFLEYQPLAYAFWVLAGATEARGQQTDEMEDHEAADL